MEGPTRDSQLTRQVAFDFRSRAHGGARPGAGRPRKKESERIAIAHRTRTSHRKGDPVHVTLAVRRRLPSLRQQVLSDVVIGALLAQRTKMDAKGAKHFQVVHFTIQRDHLHLIVEANDKRGIARGVAGLEIRIARAINKILGREGRFWADRYHRRDLRTPTETRNLLRYVLLNVRRHHRVFGEPAFADPCSSASSFDGFARPATLVDDSPGWPRVTPRTWLLGVAWRRYGLLDPADTPSARRPRRRS